jgi:hypothetical protein
VNPVFLDTVGLIALWDKADQWPDDAEPVFLKRVTWWIGMTNWAAFLRNPRSFASVAFILRLHYMRVVKGGPHRQGERIKPSLL